MSVFCPNKGCRHSHFPINRKVQAEVDVAIATKSLSMAAKDEYDILIVITGDRDFKDCFSSVSSDFGKYVNIVGFANSMWYEYYDQFYGIEVISAEKIWNKAIGKTLFNKSIHKESENSLSPVRFHQNVEKEVHKEESINASHRSKRFERSVPRISKNQTDFRGSTKFFKNKKQ